MSICKNINDVIEALKEDNWKPELDTIEDRVQSYFMNYDECDPFTIYVHYYSAQQIIVFRALFPDIIPSEKVSEISELITSVNDRRAFGTLEWDERKNKYLTCRVSYDFNGIPLTKGMVIKLGVESTSMKEYIPLVRSILSSEKQVHEISREF